MSRRRNTTKEEAENLYILQIVNNINDPKTWPRSGFPRTRLISAVSSLFATCDSLSLLGRHRHGIRDKKLPLALTYLPEVEEDRSTTTIHPVCSTMTDMTFKIPRTVVSDTVLLLHIIYKPRNLEEKRRHSTRSLFLLGFY